MRTLRILALVAALTPLSLASSGCQTLSGSATASSPGSDVTPFQGDDDFRNWFAYYYKNGNPARLTAALHFMQSNAYLSDHPDIASIFIGHIFTKEPAALASWVSEWKSDAKLKEEAWSVLLTALWFSGTKEGHELLTENLGRASRQYQDRLGEVLKAKVAPPALTEGDITDPRHINLLWAAFSATGDAAFVRKIVGAVKNYGNESDALANAIGEAAIMTLASNVPHHAVVEKVCMDENRQNPDQRTRALLETMFRILAQLAAEKDTRPAH